MYHLVNTADCGMWIQPRLGFEAALLESGLPFPYPFRPRWSQGAFAGFAHPSRHDIEYRQQDYCNGV